MAAIGWILAKSSTADIGFHPITLFVCFISGLKNHIGRLLPQPPWGRFYRLEQNGEFQDEKKRKEKKEKKRRKEKKKKKEAWSYNPVTHSMHNFKHIGLI